MTNEETVKVKRALFVSESEADLAHSSWMICWNLSGRLAISLSQY